MTTPFSTHPKIEEQHLNMVRALAKPGLSIIHDLTADNANLLHHAVGISGEAGEVLDIVKKIAIYNKPCTPDLRAKLVEELGDTEFYLRGLYHGSGISREEVLLANMKKLGDRYPTGLYSNEQAQARADKAGEQFDPA